MRTPYTYRVMWLVVAIVLFVLAALGALDALKWDHAAALGWFGLACVAAAFI
jgi:hypothetical protein